MPEILDDIVSQLRSMARRGETPANLLRYLSGLLPSVPAKKALLIKYMREAFSLALAEASPIAGWAADDSGELKDNQINQLIEPAILGHRDQWNVAD